MQTTYTLLPSHTQTGRTTSNRTCPHEKIPFGRPQVRQGVAILSRSDETTRARRPEISTAHRHVGSTFCSSPNQCGSKKSWSIHNGSIQRGTSVLEMFAPEELRFRSLSPSADLRLIRLRNRDRREQHAVCFAAGVVRHPCPLSTMPVPLLKPRL